jgi:hypothetical protein
MPAQFYIVAVWGPALLEHEHQFVLAAIKRAHAAIGLGPNANIFQLVEHCSPGGEQLADMAPVHAHESDGPVARHRGGRP